MNDDDNLIGLLVVLIMIVSFIVILTGATLWAWRQIMNVF